MFSLLYVDDEPGLLEIGRLFLENTGEFTVSTVMSGEEALALLSRTDFDAVISDYQMPEMDGIELLKQVRKSFGNIPFILFTGRGREEIVIEAINNGVDSYLQKGGDPKAQFAELAHRVRQAITKRRAETALSDSERRLADIISFLPDATFAIDTEGYVIAWNRAIVEMTGIPADMMLGKGEYEYSVAFYGARRPMLIDFVFETDEKVAEYYVNIQRDGNTISAETGHTHPKGNHIDVLAKASPLYNRDGEITGAIESIRDISERKHAEEELRATNEQLAASGEELQAQFNELAESEKRIRESESRLGFMLGFYERANKPERELLDYAVEGAGIVTNSPLGYLAFTNEDETELSMYAWSKSAMTGCTLQDKPLVYKTAKTGLWGETIRQRQPVITNNYDAPDPKKKGYPEGHPRIIRHMGIPIIEEGHIVLVAGVGNKPADYTDHDVHELILLMQGLWAILKRKRAEQTQRESEAKYRSLVEHAPVGMHFYDLKPDGSLVFTGAGPGADLILGVDNRQFIGRTIEDAFPNLAGTEIPSRYRDVAASGIVWQTDQVDYDGGKIRGAYAVTAFRIAPGSMVAMFTDITGRKRAETELQAAYEQITASEEELREQYDELSSAQGELRAHREQMEEIAATVPGVVYQFYARPDGSFGVYYVSRRAVEILGIDKSTEEFFPAFIAGIHPEDKARFMNSVHDAVKTAAPWEFTGRLIRPSGETIWIRGISGPVRHGDELVFSGVLLDITEQKREAAALEESERRYRLLAENSPDMIYFVDAGGYVKYVNEYAAMGMKSRPGDLVGKHLKELFNPETAERHMEGIRKVIASRQSTRQEMKEVLPAGEVWLEVRLSPMIDDTGTVLGVLGLSHDITDRKNTERALSESEEQFRKIFENSPLGMALVTPDFRFVSVNTAMVSMTGYTQDELLRMSFKDITHPAHLAGDLEHIRELVAGTIPVYNTEKRYIRKDGGILWGLLRVTTIRDQQGTLHYFGAQIEDITEKRKTEKSLQESYALLKGVIESPSGVVIFALDRQYRYITFNENHRMTMKQIWGREIAPGTSMLEYIGNPDDRTKAIASFDRALAGESFTITEEYGDTALERRVYEDTYNPITDVSGDVIGLTLFLTDITDRKRAEEELRESETKYRMLVESSNDIIYTLRTDGIITFVSPGWETLLGHPARDVVGKPFRQFIEKDDIPSWEAFFAEVEKTRKRQTGITYRIYHADGSIHIHTSNISPVVDENGTVVSCIGNARDITDMKRSENAIRESNRKLNLLNSITRHDLANQLTVVQGYTQLAMLRKPEPVIAEFLAKIDSAAEVMQRQIEFTRNYQELGVQAPAWYNIRDIVMAAQPQTIALTCDCDTCEVFADPMIGKVFFNLFDNAIRHGGKVSAITVRCGLSSEELVITVEDNGVGVPLDEKQKIFDKGYGKHTGFGLFLVREILAITGIFIHETGAHGRGARFEIAVPKGAYRRVKAPDGTGTQPGR